MNRNSTFAQTFNSTAKRIVDNEQSCAFLQPEALSDQTRRRTSSGSIKAVRLGEENFFETRSADVAGFDLEGAGDRGPPNSGS